LDVAGDVNLDTGYKAYLSLTFAHNLRSSLSQCKDV